MTDYTSAPWWRAFFESVDSLILSNFPDLEETALEIEALQRFLDLRPTDLIADICCGMGRHLLPLSALGYDLVGLDSSGMMLELAHRGARYAEVQARLVQGVAQALPFADASFDVMLNLFNSFGYLATVTDDVTVLREAARCLKPGGRFFLDTRNKKYQILYAPYHQAIELPDGRELVMRSKYDRDSSVLVTTWHDAAETQCLHTAAIRLYNPDELTTMLEQAGFRVRERYGNYAGSRFEGWERQLLLLCEKV